MEQGSGTWLQTLGTMSRTAYCSVKVSLGLSKLLYTFLNGTVRVFACLLLDCAQRCSHGRTSSSKILVTSDRSSLGLTLQ